MKRLRMPLIAIALMLSNSSPLPAQQKDPSAERARKIHFSSIVLDTHIDHAVKLVGADHVGLGSDFDGGSMPVGMEDASNLPKIPEALARKGYSESDIRKILGENTLRVLNDVERVAQQLKTQEVKGRK